jgi:sarcosine oxidase subunit beta
VREVEVAIVGAGVTGLSIAFHLRERRIGPVVVFDRSGIGAGASGVQPGGVRRQWSTRNHCLLADHSYNFYRDTAARLEPATRLTLEECGYLFVAHSAETLAQLSANVALQNDLGIPSEIIGPERVREIVAGLDPSSLTGAAWCQTDAYFDKPQAVVEAFGAAAWRAGAELEIAEVRGIARDGAGWRLHCTGGEPSAGGGLRAQHVVVAAGYDSPALLAPLGIDLPIVKEQRFLFLSRPVRERLLEPLLISAERRFAAKQLANGRVLASDLTATGDPVREQETWRRTVRDGIEELAPMLSYVNFDLLVDGFYDTTPDHAEILGPVDGLPGLWLAAGFSGHGFMLAPATGRAIAAWIAGDHPGEAAASFGLDRFANGALELETQVI